MIARPMRPSENALALLAALLVAGALLPWGLRVACALGAIGVLLLMAMMRTRAHRVRRAKARTANVYGQVERIRAARKERLERRPGGVSRLR